MGYQETSDAEDRRECLPPYTELVHIGSSLPGIAISHSEVTSIHATGFWLLVDDVEYFVPFDDYPVFQGATVAQIYAVQRLGPTQFHWPELDADIELEALEHPEQFPLVFPRP